jgi:hypothetical protein
MSRVAIALSVLLLVPSLASAQRAPARDKQGVTFDEVEHGFFLGVQGGVSLMNEAPAPAGASRPKAWGQLALVEVGYELLDRISIALFVMGTTHHPESAYTGFSDNVASGDFTTLVPGATARVSLVGLADSQGVERTFFYVRGGVGLATFFPKALVPDSYMYAFAGPGVEYFTRLRHFSIGLEVTGSTLLGSTATTVGVAVTPNLRYAF